LLSLCRSRDDDACARCAVPDTKSREMTCVRMTHTHAHTTHAHTSCVHARSVALYASSS
jgi:hypothetical protein